MTTSTSATPDLNGLSEWAPELAQTFVSLASDIALVLDDNGVIRSVAQGKLASMPHTAREWVGRPWADTVTGETRSKIEQILKEVTSTGLARRREINHPCEKGGNIAVAYTAMRLGQNGPLLAVGRDLGAIVAIQQRFLAAQQEMERGYWRLRQDEARYRLLFQVATDAVLVVDSLSLDILEANQAAAQLLEMGVNQLVGRQASFSFERSSRLAIDSLLTTARATGHPAEILARLLGKVTRTSVLATPFRADDGIRLMVRLRTMDMPGSSADLNRTLARLVDSASDGVLVTDTSGHIMIANPAFLKLVKMNTEADVKGRPLMDWVSVSDDQFATMLWQVRRQGIARRMSSRIMSIDATFSDVEVSAALLTEGDRECIGFTLHVAAPPHQDAAGPSGNLRLALDQISARVGIDALPELLRSAAELLERHFINVAMERAGADTVAAANLLGVSQERVGRSQADVYRSPSEGL